MTLRCHWLSFSAHKSIKCICTRCPIIQLRIWQILVGSSHHRVIPVSAHYSQRCNFIILRHEQSLTVWQDPPVTIMYTKRSSDFFFSVRKLMVLRDAERLLRELLIEATLSWSHRPCGGFVLHYQHRLNQHFNTLGFIKPRSWPGNINFSHIYVF